MRALPPPCSSRSTTSRPLDWATRSAISRTFSRLPATAFLSFPLLPQVASSGRAALQRRVPADLDLVPGFSPALPLSHYSAEHKPPVRLSLPPGVAVHQRIAGWK